MRKQVICRAWLLVPFLLCLANTANATLANKCYWDASSIPWFTGPRVVSVVYGAGTDNSLAAATGLSQTDVSDAINRALYIWNEQSGASIKLRLVGGWSQTYDPASGSILIRGNQSTCYPYSPPADGSVWFDGSNHWDRAAVTIYKLGPFCLANTWGATPTAQNDLVANIVQQLSHVAYNMGVPYQTAVFPTCSYNPGQVAGSVTQTLGRDLSNWDLEMAQQRYGVRAQYSKFYRGVMSSPTSWSVARQVAATAGATPLFRMGSMPQNIHLHGLGWVDNGAGGATLRDGGAGWYDSAGNYGSNTLNKWFYLTPSSGRPVAFASQPSTVEGQNPPVDVLIAYQKPSANIYSDATDAICWRRSTDAGTTWGSESCSGNSTVYGLAAAYDPNTKTFLISYVQRDATLYNRIVVIVVPATGSTVIGRTNIISLSALHAPGIACWTTVNRFDPGKCLMMFEGTSGWLSGTTIQVLSDGSLSQSGSYQWGLRMYDTPGVGYLPDDGTFRIIQSSANNALYSYKIVRTDPSWTLNGTGDIWNSENSQVSTGQPMIRYKSGIRYEEAWFIKYW